MTWRNQPHVTTIFGGHLPIYRYLDEKYVEQFLLDGSLMISTLERCRGLEGLDIRGDSGEGTFVSEFWGKSSGSHLTTLSQYAPPGTMILCCSEVHTAELTRRFGVNGCLRIDDAAGFFEAISAVLPTYSDKDMGPIRYLTDRTERHIVEDSLLLPPPVAIPLMLARVQNLIQSGKFTPEAAQKLSRAANGFPDEVMKIVRHDAAFCKPANPFKEEREYRMAWYSSHSSQSTHLIRCPDAIRFCSKV